MDTSTPTTRLRRSQLSNNTNSATLPLPSDNDTNDKTIFIAIEIRLITLKSLIGGDKLPLSDVHCVDVKSHQILKILLLNSLKQSRKLTRIDTHNAKINCSKAKSIIKKIGAT